MGSQRATIVDFGDIPDWVDDDHDAALAAFVRHRLKPANEIYNRAPKGCDPEALMQLVHDATAVAPGFSRDFFEQNFVPVRLARENGDGANERPIVTAFFEPEYQASRIRSDKFNIPIYARPKNLVARKDAPSGAVPDDFRFAWRNQDGSYGMAPDRAAIDQGALTDKAEVLAWLEDPIDSFFMHVQGAARLDLTDGTQMRVSYAAKTGHPFTAIGGVLVKRGAIPLESVSMQSISAWLRANPDESEALMHENRSYIFFKETPLGEAPLGPIAAAKIQLTAQRSLAVDMRYHTFATPIFVQADKVNDAPFAKLMIAQETGTAIKGPSRGDLFVGTGREAGEAAGGVLSPATFFVLCPKTGYQTYLEKWLGT
ncbi:MAG: MltA domain-containing protein [Pseudomonadota bacterium]